MASVVLSSVGSAVGNNLGGPVGSFVGSQVGKFAGSFIDSAVFGGGGSHRQLRDLSGPRLSELGVQASTYGKMVPIVYGTVRLAGNVIWSRPIKETVTTTTTSASAGGGKGGGGGSTVSQNSTSYSYSISLAIAICEGEIDDILRVWADAEQLDLSQGTFRIYTGSETQTADSFISGFEGVDNTPAYRGLAYVVLEDFPLADYGNRIPNFTFEVKKKEQVEDYNGAITEDLVTGMIMIPGAGEYVYDTQIQSKLPGEDAGGSFVQQGFSDTVNMHNPYGIANSNLSLDYLKEACPNTEWIGVVVSWFGDSLDAATCSVLPGVEYQTGATTSPDEWNVGSFNRSTAKLITQIDGSPQYGGTPDDTGLLRYLDELQSRGYKVMFYPLMFMDMSGKPWRGQLTGDASAMNNFFTKTSGYNDFINHYAGLVKNKVDAFVIGSELIGLTKVTDTPGNYPAVNELVNLAASVKTTVGAGVKVTYAADWSEYHHTDGGWYNMDPLWASANIDMISIDAYFPLKDDATNSYDIDTIRSGWTSGEGYDYYYTDAGRTTTAALSPAFAWKNIEWFWENSHVNPDTNTTGWVAESKKIWFTEYGFPSVDNAANQPNVFYDPDTSGSGFPYHSKGRVDFRAQRAGITATLHEWAGSSMVEELFLWTWDARPYPYWPDLTSVWSDGNSWKTGHWVQGKFGISSVAAIVSDLSQRTGLTNSDIDVSQITDQVEGFVLTSQQTIRDTIDQLRRTYFFDGVETDHILKFIPRGQAAIATIDQSELVPTGRIDKGELLTISRAQEVDLPKRVNVVYLNRISNYQPTTQYAQREFTTSRQQASLNLPVVISDQLGRIIADVSLYTSWVSRTRYTFVLPVTYAALEPADVVNVTANGVTHIMRITHTRFGNAGMLYVEAVAEDISAYDFYADPGEVQNTVVVAQPVAATQLELLDIPALPTDTASDNALRYAATGLGSNWRGAVVYRSDDGEASYDRHLDLPAAAVMGTALTALPDFSGGNVFDEVSTVTVSLLGAGELSSATELATLNGSNAALIGNEIVQFKTAMLIAEGKYELSGLLRARLGSDDAAASHAIGERFVLLNANVLKTNPSLSLIGSERHYKPVSINRSLPETTSQSFTHSGVALKPLSPVQVTGSRDGSDNLTVNWTRRTRLGGDWLDNADVPLNEESERYEVDILDGGNVVRTIAITSPTASYSAAEQIADFGSAQSSVDVVVYQLSAVVGRGFGANTNV